MASGTVASYLSTGTVYIITLNYSVLQRTAIDSSDIVGRAAVLAVLDSGKTRGVGKALAHNLLNLGAR